MKQVPKVWNNDLVPLTLNLLNPKSIGFDRLSIVIPIRGFHFVVLTYTYTPYTHTHRGKWLLYLRYHISSSAQIIFSNYQWYMFIKCGLTSVPTLMAESLEMGGDADEFMSRGSSLMWTAVYSNKEMFSQRWSISQATYKHNILNEGNTSCYCPYQQATLHHHLKCLKNVKVYYNIIGDNRQRVGIDRLNMGLPACHWQLSNVSLNYLFWFSLTAFVTPSHLVLVILLNICLFYYCNVMNDSSLL